MKLTWLVRRFQFVGVVIVVFPQTTMMTQLDADDADPRLGVNDVPLKTPLACLTIANGHRLSSRAETPLSNLWW